MKSCLVVLAALVAVTLASVAAAGPNAPKQRVSIDMKFHASTFVLLPFRTPGGAVARDRGTFTDDAPNAPCRKVTRDGQDARICGGRWTLTGKNGTLSIRGRVEWVDPGSGGCGVAFGTWNVVRGTGAYAGIAGGGRSAYDAHCDKWYARHEGVLSSR